MSSKRPVPPPHPQQNSDRPVSPSPTPPKTYPSSGWEWHQTRMNLVLSRYHWPEPPKEDTQLHLLQHSDGEMKWCRLYPDGRWNKLNDNGISKEEMIGRGYIGVLKPLDKEDERTEFEAVFSLVSVYSLYGISGISFERDESGEYANGSTWLLFRGWLKAKQHERRQ